MSYYYNAEYHREYYQRNKDKIKSPEIMERQRETVRKWRENNRESSMLAACKSRAKRLNLGFDLELSDIVIPEVCPITLEPLFFSVGYQHNHTPALDRIDNDKGYIKGNVRVISHRANRQKSNLSLEEIKRLYLYSIGEL